MAIKKRYRGGSSLKQSAKKVKVLEVRWQRLVTGRKTCPRCSSTGKELETAVSKLRRSLKPLGIRVALKKARLSLSEFRREPGASNRIFFNGLPLEGLINAKTGKSPCCDVCGEAECRTVKTGGRAYEVVPSALVIRAGLVAASRLIG